MVTDAAPKAAFTPAAYNAVVDSLVPQEIRLVDLTFNVRAAVHSGPLIAYATMDNPELTEQMEVHDGTTYVHVAHKAVFRIKSSDESIAAEGRATYAVRLKLGFAPPEDFWKIFLPRNIKLYTHPALRDLIASLASRAGLVVQPLASVSVVQAITRVSDAPSLPSSTETH